MNVNYTELDFAELDFTELDFTELEYLAQAAVDFSAEAQLMSTQLTYKNAPLHELFDRLEGALESYTAVQSHLATTLQASAEKEIEFFLSLLQIRLNLLLEHSQPYQLQAELLLT